MSVYEISVAEEVVIEFSQFPQSHFVVIGHRGRGVVLRDQPPNHPDGRKGHENSSDHRLNASSAKSNI